MSEEFKIVPITDKPGAFKTEDGKQFVSQELTDRLISQRLAEEKTKWEAKVGDAETKAQTAQAALEAAKTEMATLDKVKATAEDANAALADTFAAITSGMSEESKKRIPDYGTTADRIKFINKNPDWFFPKSDGAPQKIAAPVVLHKDPQPDKPENNALPSWQDMLKPGGAQAALAKLDAKESA